MSQTTDQLLRHQGYAGSVQASIEDGCLHGRLLHIDDVVTYEGDTVPALQVDFVRAVDSYLAHCSRTGKVPNRPYTGSFNVRIGADRHRWLVETALANSQSLNETMCTAIDALQAKRASTHASCATEAAPMKVYCSRRTYPDSTGAGQLNIVRLENHFANQDTTCSGLIRLVN